MEFPWMSHGTSNKLTSIPRPWMLSLWNEAVDRTRRRLPGSVSGWAAPRPPCDDDWGSQREGQPSSILSSFFLRCHFPWFFSCPHWSYCLYFLPLSVQFRHCDPFRCIPQLIVSSRTCTQFIKSNFTQMYKFTIKLILLGQASFQSVRHVLFNPL